MNAFEQAVKNNIVKIVGALKHVAQSDFDALVARVETLEKAAVAKVEAVKQPTVSTVAKVVADVKADAEKVAEDVKKEL